jgi:hypothetical protein
MPAKAGIHVFLTSSKEETSFLKKRTKKLFLLGPFCPEGPSIATNGGD